MGAVPADYFEFYYFTDDVLAELRAKRDDARGGHPRLVGRTTGATTRSRPRATTRSSTRRRSRGGIHELELAIDVMDAIFNDKDEIHPVNMPNAGGALPGFPDDLVVEVLGRCHGGGIDVLPAKPLPRHVRGLVEMLGEYQALAAETAWAGTRADGIRALSANPLVRQVEVAERVYDALAAAHRHHLPPECFRSGAGLSTLLLGVDGGNTKTVAFVAADDGIVLGSGSGGCGDIHGVGGPEPALAEIVRAATAALDAAGATAAGLAAAAFSLAGADWPEDFAFLRTRAPAAPGAAGTSPRSSTTRSAGCAPAPTTWSAWRW